MVRRYHIAIASRLGRNIAHYRHRAGLTQEQLAESIDVEIATVSRYETGATLPSIVTLEALAALLHTSIAELLAEKPPERSKESEKVLALIEPLTLAERQLIFKVLKTFVGFLREQRTGRPRKQAK